jgi:hypothetical protein
MAPITARAQRHLHAEPEPLKTALYTVPSIAANLLPGFGLGSYIDGEPRSGIWLTAADVLGIGLIALGSWGVSQHPDSDEGGGYVIALLTGYGVYAGSKVAGITLPILQSARGLRDTDALFAPLVYNTFPGFGAGSHLQGDFVGRNLIAAFDAIAFVSVGALSLVALGGLETPTAVFGITAAGSYLAARVLGVVRPIVYRSRRSQ